MALLWIDGFDHYTSGQIQRVYEESGSVEISTSIKRNGTSSIRAYQTTTKYLGVNAPTLIIGAAVYVDNGSYTNWDTSGPMLFAFNDGTTQQCKVMLGPSGMIGLYRGSTRLDQTPELSYPLKAWFHLEVKLTFSGSAGSWDVRVNERLIRSLGGLNTAPSGNGYANRIVIGANSWNVAYVDDLYVCDTSGTLNNDFLGDIKVLTAYPNAEGTYLQWTPSSGTTHYTLVNEATPNDDTNYVSTNTVGNTETLNFQDVTLTGTIRGILQLACIRKDDAGARQAALICRSGATDYEGPQQSVSDSYLYLKQLRETDPATGALWTVSGLNAAEFGVRMKA